MSSGLERDPKKRRVKPIESQASLLDFDLGESSDDSDFRIEDHAEPSDDDDSLDSQAELADSTDEDDSEEDSEDSEAEIPQITADRTVADVIDQASKQLKFDENDEAIKKILICCGCLGDRSDDANEIVECDGCGVTVHEGCYGVSDTASVSSTVSSCSTEPWFCEACRAGVTNPVCELCPNSGGIYKETDVGKWVHLVCALYVPGVAFGEVDHLTSVTLFEMAYSRWGNRICCLCTDNRYARTGICIGCDAGMCRTYFHVTCAQREGYLSEAHSEEVDQADPFYAHCKLHSDKTLVRRRKRNWLALQLRMQQRKVKYGEEGYCDKPQQLRIQRKLNKYRHKFLVNKSTKVPPWVPTQKMARLLTTSASACRKLLKKAELMGIDTVGLEMQEAQIAALQDVRKKWHIPPAFSVEFIGYYLDRNNRLSTMKQGLEQLISQNVQLLEEQQQLRIKYDQMMKDSSDESRINISLKQTIHKYYSAILSACPNKNLPSVDDLGKSPVRVQPSQPTKSMAVPTAAALKMGVGFPLNNRSHQGNSGRVLSSQAQRQDNLLLNNDCGICHKVADQHLLAKCDTCHLYYHLYCLNPPLTRLPKKSKLYGWQCSECDKTSESEQELIAHDIKTPRRTRYSAQDDEAPVLPPTVAAPPVPTEFAPVVKIKPLENFEENHPFNVTIPQYISKSGKKRRRDKHRSRYSPDMLNSSTSSSREHKRKRKKKNLELDEERSSTIIHPRITIKIKSIPLQPGEKSTPSKPQMFYVPTDDDELPPTVVLPPPKPPSPPRPVRERFSVPRPQKFTKPVATFDCCVCNCEGSAQDSVQCDDCRKCYHFTCLDPPLKKTPKRRGYSWHCADCDPTASDSN